MSAANDIEPPTDGHMDDSSPVGRTLAGRYAIRRVLGRGGMGVVYLATDTEQNLDVVVKVLGGQWSADDKAIARFEREAERLSSLRHPNIVEMFDYGHEDERAFLVMQYVRGVSLAEYVQQRGELRLEEFVPIAAQILKAVGYAHSREVIIRDIKPSNIMLCERKGRANYVMVLDFGLAKRVHDEVPITREHVMGTAGYIAPEALKQEAEGLPLDVYALGVLFWYLLTGELPYEAENDAAVFYKTVHDPIPSMAELLGRETKVPAKLMELVESCLAKEPEDRPDDANAIIELLIDAVPAKLFRLPRIPSDAYQRPGEGNSGLISLTGVNPSGQHAGLVATTAVGPSSTPSVGSATRIEGSGVPGPREPERTSSRWPWLLLGVAATTALFWIAPWSQDEEPTPAPMAAQQPPVEAEPAPSRAAAPADDTAAPVAATPAGLIAPAPAPAPPPTAPDEPEPEVLAEAPSADAPAADSMAVPIEDPIDKPSKRRRGRRGARPSTPVDSPAPAAADATDAPPPPSAPPAAQQPEPASPTTDDSVFLHEDSSNKEPNGGLMPAD